MSPLPKERISAGMWPIRYVLEQGNRLRGLPALLRDLWASAFVLTSFAAAVALPLVTLPAAALVLLPVLLFAAVLFGRDSALLAALLAALMARLIPAETVESPVGSLTIAALSGAALAMAAFLEELRRSRAEAETAYLRSDATARLAAERVETARRRLREAEERLAEVERQVLRAGQEARAPNAPARSSSRDPALESAFRSEGGI